MDNRNNRWLAGTCLVTLFGVIALAGGRAQGTQNVLVTNTSSQQVPVLPPARPAPGGAYIVSVANAPSVKVISSPATPISTKEVHDIDAASNFAYAPLRMQPTFATVTTGFTLSASAEEIVDGINVFSTSTASGEVVDLVELVLLNGVTVDADYGYRLEAVNHSSTITALSLNTRILVPAGDKVQLYFYRFGGTTGGCNVSYNLAYHPVG